MANFGIGLSRYKMVVYMKGGEKKIFYSLIKEEQKSPTKVVSNMVRRLLFGLYHGKYQTAMIYDTHAPIDEAFQKWCLGHREY